MWHEPTQVHRNKTGGTTTGQPTPESCASIPASSIPASQHLVWCLPGKVGTQHECDRRKMIRWHYFCLRESETISLTTRDSSLTYWGPPNYGHPLGIDEKKEQRSTEWFAQGRRAHHSRDRTRAGFPASGALSSPPQWMLRKGCSHITTHERALASSLETRHPQILSSNPIVF